MNVSEVNSEYRLLGSFLDDPTPILSVSEELFTDERRRLFRAIRECWVQYGELAHEGIERFYGQPLPSQLIAARGGNAAPIIDRLARLANKRQLVHMAIAIDLLSDRDDIDPDEVRAATAYRPVLAAHDTGLVNGAREFVSDITRKRNGQYRFVETGLPFLDYALGGEWPRQALTVVMGRAGGGKTALVCNAMLRMAQLDDPIPSLFISLEMRKRQLVSRLVAALARVDGNNLRTGRLTDDDMCKIDSALDTVQRLPIYIDDRPRLTTAAIISQMREHRERHQTPVVFIDYLQIVDTSNMRQEREHEVLADITQQLRNAAVELDMSVVLLAQQNRGQQGMDSLYGSVRVTQIADTIFEIKLEPENLTENIRVANFIFHKNREGPVGTFNARYFPNYLTFE